jgi:hypothetical protein
VAGVILRKQIEAHERVQNPSQAARPGKPSYHGAFFLLTKEPMLSSWSKLGGVVKSGRPVLHINQEQEGSSFFLRFVEDIFPIHYPGAQALARALGLESEPVPISVLDLAAGSGVWSVAIAQQSPHNGRLSLLPILTERQVGPSRFPRGW